MSEYIQEDERPYKNRTVKELIKITKFERGRHPPEIIKLMEKELEIRNASRSEKDLLLDDIVKNTTKGKIRSFGAYIGLSIITLGFYTFYWLYINLKEIKEAFTFDENETTIKTAQKLLIAYIIFSVIVVIVTLPLALSQPGEIQPTSKLFSLIGAIFGAILFYYYTASVALGQNKSQLTAFEISSIYTYYIIGLILAFIGNFIPFMYLLGGIFILIYIYKIQQEINRIWLKGKKDDAFSVEEKAENHKANGRESSHEEALKKKPKKEADAISYCPKCHVQYSEGYNVCSDCEILLTRF